MQNNPPSPEERLKQINDLAQRYIDYSHRVQAFVQAGSCQVNDKFGADDWQCCAGHKEFNQEITALIEEAASLGIESKSNPLSLTWWQDAGL